MAARTYLAASLGISRKTVADAYALPAPENGLVGKVDRGTCASPRPV
ncbi:hypothetical protein [Pseudomonas sp. KCJK8993]